MGEPRTTLGREEERERERERETLAAVYPAASAPRPSSEVTDRTLVTTARRFRAYARRRWTVQEVKGSLYHDYFCGRDVWVKTAVRAAPSTPTQPNLNPPGRGRRTETNAVPQIDESARHKITWFDEGGQPTNISAPASVPGGGCLHRRPSRGPIIRSVCPVIGAFMRTMERRPPDDERTELPAVNHAHHRDARQRCARQSPRDDGCGLVHPHQHSGMAWLAGLDRHARICWRRGRE